MATGGRVKGSGRLWALVAALVIALVGVALYKAWPLLYPELTEVAPLDPACDLHQGPCLASLSGGGQIRLGIEPRSLPASQPLELLVLTEGLDVREVAVDFQGVDMNMGFNRVPLQPLASGRFGGSGTLPACVRSHMTWEARVLARTPRGLVAAPFRFETQSPGQ